MTTAYCCIKQQVIKAMPMLIGEGILLSFELAFSRLRAGAYGGREQTMPVPTAVPADKGLIAPETVPPAIAGIIRLINEPERLRRAGAHMWKGILLTGSSGVGKTDLGFYIARQTGARVMYKSASDLVQPAQGAAARAVRQLFERVYDKSIWVRFMGLIKYAARRLLRRREPEQKPVVLILDEIDSIGYSREDGVTDEERAREADRNRALEELLTQLDGAHEQTILPKVLVIGTTNRPARLLDEALVRPGRLHLVHVPSLNHAGRVAVLHSRATQFQMSNHVNLDHIADKTEGLNGAALTDLLNSAALKVAARGDNQIESGDLTFALRYHKNFYARHIRQARLPKFSRAGK